MLTWLGGGDGWRSKRFPVIVAQRGWFSAGTTRNLTQATQQARGRRFVGTLAWSTYKLCPATVAQPQKLLYEHGVGVVGTLAWSTYKLCTATVAQPLNLTTCTGLAWSARWRGQRINGALLRWHNGRSNMHRASLSVVNTAHCPATTSVALIWVSAEGWLRSIYVLHT